MQKDFVRRLLKRHFAFANFYRNYTYEYRATRSFYAASELRFLLRKAAEQST